ncbi:MAG: hypothetical protein MSC31_17325 [Solirubrobacteraceae bacterium MAG38_C4-C5]|nr:hypothetical protein [Candidatus Siliceabacter maunaloa]
MTLTALAKEHDAFEQARRRGRYSETWLTAAMRYALAADERAAGCFAGLVVQTLEPVRMTAPPERLQSSPQEEGFRGGALRQRGRRADFLFRNADGTYGLMIEAKLGAVLSAKQLPDYLRLRPAELGLRPDAELEVAVLAARSLAVSTSRARANWLGCATWQEVVDALVEIPFEDGDRSLRWAKLLERYRHDRGFGTRRGVNLPPASALDSSVVRIVAAACEASNGALRIRALPWGPQSQLVVRKRARNASMCIQLKAPRSRPTDLLIHLEHPQNARPFVQLIRPGRVPEELASFPVHKNADRCRQRIACEVARLVVERVLP